MSAFALELNAFSIDSEKIQKKSFQVGLVRIGRKSLHHEAV